MTTIYTIDSQGIYTSAVEVTDPLASVPMGVTIPPPELTGTQVARWIVTGWEVLPEYPAPPPPPAPTSCSRRQAELALLQVGMLDTLQAAIEAIADPIAKRRAQIEYSADVWERSNPFLQSMWAQLGGTTGQLDELYRLAVNL